MTALITEYEFLNLPDPQVISHAVIQALRLIMSYYC